MSDPGYVEPTPASESPERDSSYIPLWAVLTALAVMLAGAGVVAFVLLGGALDTKEKEKGPSYPSAWDPRIAPYTKVVEKKRGLTFLHPVEVRFLADEAFEKSVRTDEKDLSKDDRKELEQLTGLFRAMGLISGDVDLFDAFNDAQGAGTLAYYDFKKKRITIRGTSLPAAARPTLVHELTHVLQDQHFDLGDRNERYSKAEKADRDRSTESSVFDALAEGDAERVATLYKKSLPAKQRKALESHDKSEGDQFLKDAKEVPEFVITLMSSPYVLGEALVQTVAEAEGNSGVDELFRDPPSHDAVLLDPFLALSGNAGTAKVAVPGLAKGEKKFDTGEFGALSWYFVLAERLPLIEALDAATGWGGDAYVAFEREGTSCLRLAATGKSKADTARLLAATQHWITASRGSKATVRLAGNRVVLESCDPGTKAAAGKDTSMDALELASVRGYFGAEFLDAGAPEKAARCIVNQLVREFSVRQLTGSGASPAFRTRIQQIARSCR